MYKVKATASTGPVTFGCGTPEQAMEKVVELIARGLGDVRVIDPAGKETTADDFKRKFFGEGV